MTRCRRLLQPHYYRSYKYGVFVALLGLLGRLSVVGRVGRHVELFLDAWDGRGPLGLRPDVASFILKTSRSRSSDSLSRLLGIYYGDNGFQCGLWKGSYCRPRPRKRSQP